MTALPPIADLTGSSITEAQAKTWFSNLRGYLSGLFGDDGNITTALDTLSAIFAAGVSAKSGAYTVAASDRGILINCTGTWTLTLLAAATAGPGFAFAVRNSGTGVITIDGNASETIDGATTVALAAGDAAFCVCTGAGWVTVARTNIPIPVPVASGGTGATTASDAADNLSVVKRDHGHGGVGSLCFAGRSVAAGTTIANPGDTYAGSSLKAAGVQDEGESVTAVNLHGTSLSGTWRCLGFLRNQGSSALECATLFQRIS